MGKFASCTDPSITTRAACVDPKAARRLQLSIAPREAGEVGVFTRGGDLFTRDGDLFTRDGDLFTRDGDLFTRDGDLPGDDASWDAAWSPEVAKVAQAYTHPLSGSDASRPPLPMVALPSAIPLAGPNTTRGSVDGIDNGEDATSFTLGDDGDDGELAANRRRARAHSGRRRLAGRALKGSGGGGAESHLPVAWINPVFGSFDSFPSAMLILYIAATGDGWEDFMFAGMDAVGVGHAPVRNDFSPASLYFIAWLLVGTFTTINLFVGSVVDHFTRVKAEQDGSVLMTKAQKQWVRTMREGRYVRPPRLPRPPRSAVLRPFFDLVTSTTFDFVITTVILLNILVMAMDFHHIEEYPGWHAFYTTALALFGCIYYAECLLKLLGLGFATYFGDNWNRFDFFLVCTSLLDQFAAEAAAAVLPLPPSMMRMMRVLRIMRILRLLKGFKGLRDLLATIALSFPSFINVGALLALVTFIYAVLGVQLFTYLMHGEEINDQRNFEHFGNAYLLLMQCLTGDNWSGLMYDSMVGPERGCDPEALPSDCGSKLAIPYFVSFTVIGTFVLLNLVVAVILENFTALSDLDPQLVSASDIADLGDEWAKCVHLPRSPQIFPCISPCILPDLPVHLPPLPFHGPLSPSIAPLHRYDDDNTCMLTEETLALVLIGLPPPLGLGAATDEHTALKVIRGLALARDDGPWLAFKPVAEALIHRSYAIRGHEPVDHLIRSPDVTSRADSPEALGGMAVGAPTATAAADAATATAGGAAAAGGATPAEAALAACPPPPATRAMRMSALPPQTLPTPARLPPPSTPAPNASVGATVGATVGVTVGGRRIGAPPNPPPGAPPPLPGGWRVVSTHAGAYYYNVETKQVSWQPPIEWLRRGGGSVFERPVAQTQSAAAPSATLPRRDRPGWDA